MDTKKIKSKVMALLTMLVFVTTVISASSTSNSNESETSGSNSASINGSFDAWDTFRDINNRNISTKIVNQNFNLKIVALNKDGSSYKDFNGTVCSRIVKNNGGSVTGWKKNLFSNTSSSNQTFNVPQAIKNAKVEIIWEKGVDTNCSGINTFVNSNDEKIKADDEKIKADDEKIKADEKTKADDEAKNKNDEKIKADDEKIKEDEKTKADDEKIKEDDEKIKDDEKTTEGDEKTNSNGSKTTSSDNFAIRPDKFNIGIDGTVPRKAGHAYNITFKALDGNNTNPQLTTNYNELAGNSFKIDVNETKIGCLTGSFKNSSYNEVGKVNIVIKDSNDSNSFAYIDKDDTSDSQRLISSDNKNIIFIPDHFNINAILTNGGNNYTYLSSDLNMSATLDINITSKTKNSTTTANYNSACYAQKTDYIISHTNLNITPLNAITRILYKETNTSTDGNNSINADITLANISKNIFSTINGGRGEIYVNGCKSFCSKYNGYKCN